MAEPLDAIKAIHNAFRADMTRIDAAALESARGNKEITPTIERFRFFNELPCLGKCEILFPKCILF